MPLKASYFLLSPNSQVLTLRNATSFCSFEWDMNQRPLTPLGGAEIYCIFRCSPSWTQEVICSISVLELTGCRAGVTDLRLLPWNKFWCRWLEWTEYNITSLRRQCVLFSQDNAYTSSLVLVSYATPRSSSESTIGYSSRIHVDENHLADNFWVKVFNLQCLGWVVTHAFSYVSFIVWSVLWHSLLHLPTFSSRYVIKGYSFTLNGEF